MLRLITMPPSHFSEKARWALDRSGLAYAEERHAPLFHRFALKKVGARNTVPALVTDSGTLTDSCEILRYVDAHSSCKLYPEGALGVEVGAFETEVSSKFGPAIPRWAYFYLIPHRSLYTRICTQGAPGKERLVFGMMAPIIGLGMKKGLNINREAAERAAARIEEYLDKVSTMLSDGRRYLFGDQFTAADLTWAALAAPPTGATGFRGSSASEGEVPAEMRAQVEKWRATPAGQFVHRLYAEHRQ